jgi:hypothetical protein
MKFALEEHPSWNGDWTRPDGIQEEEIDTRTGKALNADPTSNPEPTPTPAETPDTTNPGNPNSTENPQQTSVNVPTEFRRKELFISGTVPYPTTEEETPTETPYEYPPDSEPNPSPKPQYKEDIP